MCDSGISLCSSIRDYNSEISDGETDYEYTEEHIQPKLGVKYVNLSMPQKLVKSQMIVSSSNLSTQAPSQNLSRASSTLSLAPSSYQSSSPVTVMEVRTLTNNFEKMLAQATQEIKKLNVQKMKLEKEQEKLLTVNIEIAIEAKRLVKESKEGKEEKEGLLAANDEFAEEVKRLYREEEIWEEEIIKLKAETADISERLGRQLERVHEDWDEEKRKHKIQEEKLAESVRVLTFDNDRLLQERQRETIINSKSNVELKADYSEQIMKLETTIACLKSEKDSEQIFKEEGVTHIEELVRELEKVEQNMEMLREDHADNMKKIRERYTAKLKLLEIKSEKLAAENFEYVVENEELDKKLKVTMESRRRLDGELTQLKVENQWLVSSKKNGYGSEEKVEDMERELHDLKRDLRDEKEKVKNLADWKSQLAEKNKQLKDENTRLQKKTEDLEHVMNDEVTDINEMLKSINNLQDGKQTQDMKNMKRFM